MLAGKGSGVLEWRGGCHRWSMWEVSVEWEGLRGAGMEGRVPQVVHVGGECWLGRAQGSWDGGEGATGGPCGR